MIETPLSGGRTTPGVVRVGDTVRRPASSNSAFIARALRHLERAGFSGAPRILGRDEQGRDILSFIAGDVPTDLGWHDDDVLADAARLIRVYHDSTAELAEAANSEVLCHNDLSPCNFVFRDGRPVAIIDFDAVAPGTRAHDMGYAVWLWLDIGNPEIPAAEQWRRLALFARSYGSLSPDTVVQAMVNRQRLLAQEGQRTGDKALATWAMQCSAWTEDLRAMREGS